MDKHVTDNSHSSETSDQSVSLFEGSEDELEEGNIFSEHDNNWSQNQEKQRRAGDHFVI